MNSRIGPGILPIPLPGTATALFCTLTLAPSFSMTPFSTPVIRDGFYDKRFVQDRSTGFEDWTDKGGQEHIGFRTVLMNHFGPDEVSRITGVEKGVIE
ncbi:hypothetical protein ACFL4G_07065, partial [Thermodesulfobacteriota bacterium]